MLLSSCSAHREGGNGNRLANLKRAARLPWRDDGRCAVQESSEEWATLVEKCYDALDLSRIRFVDRKGICSTAQVGAISADKRYGWLGSAYSSSQNSWLEP
jgi:hypothetical protein